MRIAALLVLLLIAGAVCRIEAVPESRFSAGVIVGEPTGLSVKVWLGRISAVDCALAWSFLPRSILHMHTNLLLHSYTIFTPRSGTMPFTAGAGLTLRAGESVMAGMRIPVGFAYFFDAVPLELFAELAPRLDMIPDIGIGLNAAVGIRYTFVHR